MLTPKYLKFLPREVVNIFQTIEDEILTTLAARLSKDIRVSATSDFQIGQLLAMGYDGKDIEEELIKRSTSALIPMENILRSSSELNYANDQALYARGGKDLPPMDIPMKNFIASAIKQASYDVANITQSLGVATNNGNLSLLEYYRESINKATFEMGTGLYTTEEIVNRAIKPLADSGIRTINYTSGRADHIDVAVRRSILTTNAKISGMMSMRNAQDMGQDLMEITAHYGARPSHAEFQGQVVSLTGASGYLTLSDVGYNEGWGLFGYNCGHDWYPFFEGLSTPLEEVIEPEPFTFGDKEYTSSYEAAQYQRKIERDIRATKREINAYKGANLSTNQRNAEVKLNRQRELYRDFLKASDRRAVSSMVKVQGNFSLKDIGFKDKTKTPNVFRPTNITKNYPTLSKQQLKKAHEEMYGYLTQYDMEHVLGRYVSSAGSFSTNKYMYDGKYAEDLKSLASGSGYIIDKEKFKRANELSELISRNELPYDIKLFRYTGRNEMGDILNKLGLQGAPDMDYNVNLNNTLMGTLNSLKGAKYKTDSFVSTSFDDKRNEFTHKPVKIEILADKGVKGIITDNWRESEIILNAGYEFEIVEFKVENRKVSQGTNLDLLTMVVRVIK